jgi:tetratricopeptide (TPR) repeat protein
MGQEDFDRIQPASLDLGVSAGGTSAAGDSRGQKRVIFLVLALLALTAAAVVFLLPRMIPETSAPEDPTAPISPASSAAPASRPAATSPGAAPWEQAQAERERAAAKEALDVLLQRQFELQERNVEKWAQQEFAAATALAREGDELYRASSFREAGERYTTAADQLQALLSGMGARLQERIGAGDAALAQEDADAATRHFAEALAIEPHNEAANQGMQRASVLNEVIALLRQGQSAESSGQLEEARKAYDDALALDPHSAPARARLDALQSRIDAENYAALMSRGYAALGADDPAAAKRHFAAAARLRPDATEARDGLQQAEFQLSQSRITALLAKAESAAAEEQWQLARDTYEALLSIDASLAPAIEGKRRADTRLSLDAALYRLTHEPESLGSDEALAAAKRLVASAAAIPDPGPRLRAQLEAAGKAITDARTPIPVVIRSDDLTEVTVFRVGNLGTFSETSLALYPGKYVAVGQRSGYRDVRIEFAVTAGEQAPAVTVACRQRI